MARTPFLKIFTASESYTVPSGKYFMGTLWNILNTGSQLRIGGVPVGIGDRTVGSGPAFDGMVLPAGTVVQGADTSGYSGMTGFIYDN